MNSLPTQDEVDAVAFFVEALEELKRSPLLVEEYRNLGLTVTGNKMGRTLKGHFPSPEHVARMEEELNKYNKTYQFKSFDNTGHSFFTMESPAYRQDAARSGWKKIFQFYEEHLR